jgi:hypothetical protein
LYKTICGHIQSYKDFLKEKYSYSLDSQFWDKYDNMIAKWKWQKNLQWFQCYKCLKWRKNDFTESEKIKIDWECSQIIWPMK